MLTFMLGAFAVLGDPAVAAAAGVAAAVLLATKVQLHGWLARITWPELRAGLILAAMTFIALPLLPHRAIDPYGAINPYELWLMTILIAAVSFAGYAAIRIAGPERGTVLAAAAGGLVASTAVTLTLARLARDNPARVRLLGGSVILSGAIMLLRVLVVVAVINLAFARSLAPALLAGCRWRWRSSPSGSSVRRPKIAKKDGADIKLEESVRPARGPALRPDPDGGHAAGRGGPALLRRSRPDRSCRHFGPCRCRCHHAVDGEDGASRYDVGTGAGDPDGRRREHDR